MLENDNTTEVYKIYILYTIYVDKNSKPASAYISMCQFFLQANTS